MSTGKCLILDVNQLFFSALRVNSPACRSRRKNRLMLFVLMTYQYKP